MATWTIPEEFAREHTRKLRELASVLQATRDEPEAGFDPVRPDELERLAVEFERAVQPAPAQQVNAELLAAPARVMKRSTEDGSMSHTPGPWKVFALDETTEVQSGNGDPVVFWAGFDRSEIPLARHRANARLIAAAPELLSLLEEMRPWCIPGMNWTDEIGKALLKKVDAAIAKARGDASCSSSAAMRA